jgi:tetratricopeptide (TPR) repeat protein
MDEQEKRYWVDKDGNIYGPFSAQDDGFPCAGEVIRFYRIFMKMSVKEFAAELKVSARRVQYMEKDNIVPDSMERRRFIAKTLKIPPLLLGLASVESFLRPAEALNAGTKSPVVSSAIRLAVDEKTIAQYQSQLSWFWSLHYTSSASGVMSQVKTDILHLQALIACTNGKEQEKLVEQLCGFYELAARVESDRNNSESALNFLNAAIELAQPLNNVELYGRLLYKRGLVLYETRRFPEALTDLEEANQLTPKLTSPLAGSVLLELGLVKSYLVQPTSLTDRGMVLEFFNQAERYTRLSQTDEGMGIRYDSGRYLTARSEGLILLRRFEEAEETLDLAQEETSPDLTRRQLFIDLQRVKLHVQKKEYPVATVLAYECVGKAKAVASLYSIKSLEEITSSLFESSYGRSDDAVELLQVIGKAKKKLL